MTLHKNKIYQGKVSGYTEQGTGIIVIDNKKVLIEHVLLDEEVEFKLIKLTKRIAVGKCLSIIKPSEFRVKPRCKISQQCGGCQLQHISYDRQLQFKTKKIEQAFHNAAIKPPKISIIKGPQFNYRNKLQLSIQRYKGKPVIGLYKAHSHQVVDMPYCDIANPLINDCLKSIRTFLEEVPLSIYDEASKEGLYRYVIIRASEETNESQLCIVLTNHDKNTISTLLNKFKKPKHLKGIVININDSDTDTLLGHEAYTVYGKPIIEEQIDNKRFMLDSQSFFQVNTVQCKNLYRTLLNAITEPQERVILDAHCGVGSIGLFLAEHVKKVIAVDSNKAAISLAKENITFNGTSNMIVKHSRIGEISKSLLTSHSINTIILDPPRQGCETELLDTLATSTVKPKMVKQLIYVSCNIKTFIQDLEHLRHHYNINELFLFDLFAQTYHTEVLCILSNRN